MIERLHNLANTILGIEDLRIYEMLYRFVIINEDNYKIELKNESGEEISPIKQSKDNKVEYSLNIGIYYLRCYLVEENKTTKMYYQEIYVSNEMLGTSKTIKV